VFEVSTKGVFTALYSLTGSGIGNGAAPIRSLVQG
jgi:hypothetical protein